MWLVLSLPSFLQQRHIVVHSSALGGGDTAIVSGDITAENKNVG